MIHQIRSLIHITQNCYKRKRMNTKSITQSHSFQRINFSRIKNKMLLHKRRNRIRTQSFPANRQSILMQIAMQIQKNKFIIFFAKINRLLKTWIIQNRIIFSTQFFKIFLHIFVIGVK